VEATWAVRQKFAKAGTGFVDVFAGPGRSKRTDNGEIVDGSSLIALKHARAPFTSVVLGEQDPDNLLALSARTLQFGPRVHIEPGDSIANIERLAQRLPPQGLNLGLVDPFGPQGLRWNVVAALAALRRMDLIIHFPTVGSRRNFRTVDFDAMVGTPDWRKHPGPLLQQLVSALKSSLERVGYPRTEIRDVPVRNNQRAVLYHLVFAARHPLGDKIWKSIIKIEASGQRGFGF